MGVLVWLNNLAMGGGTPTVSEIVDETVQVVEGTIAITRDATDDAGFYGPSAVHKVYARHEVIFLAEPAGGGFQAGVVPALTTNWNGSKWEIVVKWPSGVSEVIYTET